MRTAIPYAANPPSSAKAGPDRLTTLRKEYHMLKLDVPQKACHWEEPACVQAMATIDPITNQVVVVVTDTKMNDKHGDLAPQLTFTATEWSAFIEAAKQNAFDIEELDLNQPVTERPAPELV